ncbi:hypothetical protein K3495_g6925 [Podosphaera aphanis]|nr:hypothetical protein K3495_g6925 [Podosphaera aphanis]
MTSDELFDELWDDFNTFELKHFQMLTRDVCKPIRAFLRDHGVWVRNERNYSIAHSLYDCIRSDKNVWLDENTDTISELKAEQSPTLPIKHDDEEIPRLERNLESLPNFEPPPSQYVSSSTAHHPYGRDMANLAKSYINDLKYTGDTDDNFDDKFGIFMEMCSRFGIANEGLVLAFPTMLSNIALSFYFNRCRGKNLTELCKSMRENFEGPEYHRYDLQKWSSLIFQSIIDQYPDKMVWNRTDEALHSKIITACKCVEVCKMVCYRPSPTVPGPIRDLRSGIQVFNKPLPKSDISSHQQQRDPTLNIDNAYFTDRKYHDGSNAKTYSFKPGQGPRIKRCWICKEECRSGEHPRSEIDENKRKLLNNLNKKAEQYISEFEGEHEEIEFENDVEMQALFEELN